MNAQNCFESLDFFYVESGLHFTFPEIINAACDNEMVVFLVGNMRQYDIENYVIKFYNQSVECSNNVRFVFIHLDGLYIDESCDLPMNVFLSFEEEGFNKIDEKIPLTFSIECFHCEPSDSEKLSNVLNLTEPIYCSYIDGVLFDSFSTDFPDPSIVEL